MDEATSEKLLRIHGYLALAAFIFVLPLSVIVIALGRRWDLWLIAHITLVMAATLMGVASVAFGVAGSQVRGHLTSTHQKLGVALCAAYVLIVCNGIYISLKWNNDRVSAPLRDKIHWTLGRFLLVFSFAVCFHGYVAGGWGLWVYVVTVVFWFIWLLLYGVLGILACTAVSEEESV